MAARVDANAEPVHPVRAGRRERNDVPIIPDSLLLPPCPERPHPSAATLFCMSSFPGRFVNLASARAQFGPRVDRFGRFLSMGDPLADAAVDSLATLAPPERERMIAAALAGDFSKTPAPLKDLLDALDPLPVWADLKRADHGGGVFLRGGVLTGLVLAFKSLVGGYLSPGGNKPLIFSGRLEEDVPRRLAETGKFVEAVCKPQGMARHGEGFATTVRVRLVHAQVRRMLLRSGRWDHAEWGVPINQHDMAGTALLFSLIVLEGLEQLGVETSRPDREDVMHLWRVVGHVMGVDQELLCATEAEGQNLAALIRATQAPPDDGARALAKVLLEGPVRQATSKTERVRAMRFVALNHALTRHFLGDEIADQLDLPRPLIRYSLPVIKAAVSTSGRALRLLPFSRATTLRAGMAYWRKSVEVGLGAEPATFALPEKLAGLFKAPLHHAHH